MRWVSGVEILVPGALWAVVVLLLAPEFEEDEDEEEDEDDFPS